MTSTTITADEQVSAHRRDETLTRLLDADLSQPLAFVALAVVYVLSRLPLLTVGYGTDPDAWRIALSGYYLWDNFEYYPSRLPGYPVPELAYASVIQGGSLATNLLTVAISLLGLWFFARIVALLRIPNSALAVVGFAFTPLVWINSMSTMDYMWAITFVLGSYYFLLTRSYFFAAVMLGLAIGSRSTSLVFLLPLAIWIWRSGRRDELRPFIFTSLAVAFLCYTPVMWGYNLRFINFYDSDVGYLNVLRLLGKDTLGIFGSLAVLGAIAFSLPRLARLPRDVLHDRDVMVWVLAIALCVLVFVRLPHEAAYLLPLYPFGFLLMARYFHRYALSAVVVVVLLAGFVDITTPGDEITLSSLADASIGKGLILSNQDTQHAQHDFVDDIEAFQKPTGAYVLLGFIYPQFVVLNRDHLEVGLLEKDRSSISQLSDKGMAYDPAAQVTYVWLLDWDDFGRLRSDGTPFLYTPDAGRSSAALYGFRPGILGAMLIDLGRGPTGGSGAARTDR
jgi:hypothetical protein